jgi:hypothetical protein
MNDKNVIDKTINNKFHIDTSSIDIEAWVRNFKPMSKKDLLALDTAKALGDMKNLGLYLSYCRRYPEGLIRKVLGIVKELPPEKIRKSRGALFNYLVQKHGNGKTDNSGN